MQKGFSIVLGMIVGLLVIVGGIYFYTQRDIDSAHTPERFTTERTGEETLESKNTVTNSSTNDSANRITSDSMEYFSFVIPDGWKMISDTQNEIKLESDNDLITIKYFDGDRYYNLDSKMGSFEILRRYDSGIQDFCYKITSSSERDFIEGNPDSTREECLKDIDNVIEGESKPGRPIWIGKGRWKTYVIATYNGFISVNIQGSGDTSALEELKSTFTFPINYSG